MRATALLAATVLSLLTSPAIAPTAFASGPGRANDIQLVARILPSPTQDDEDCPADDDGDPGGGTGNGGGGNGNGHGGNGHGGNGHGGGGHGGGGGGHGGGSGGSGGGGAAYYSGGGQVAVWPAGGAETGGGPFDSPLERVHP